MTDEQLKSNIAKNLTALRKASGMTQAELGEKLTYSDKSVSKWERGDGLPDIIVLQKLAELYGVTVNDIISGGEPSGKKKKPYLTNRIIIPLLSVGLVFLVASVIFFLIRIFGIESIKTWLIFLYAVPVSFIPLIVFSYLWWGEIARFVTVSALIWSLAFSLKASFSSQSLNFIFITAAIMQLLVVLWTIMRYRAAIRRRKEKERAASAAAENSEE